MATPPYPLNRNYELILFDLNGTLVDIYHYSEYMQNIQRIAAILGAETVRFEKAWHKTWKEYPYGDYPSVETRMKRAIELYADHNIDSHLNMSPPVLAAAISLRENYIRDQQLKIRPGVFEFFDWAIAQGYRLGLVSNCSMETPLFWPTNPIAKYLPDPTFSCLVKIMKPHPEIFLHEINKRGITDPHKCIYIADGDDHEFDTAEKLGMPYVLITYDTTDVFRHEPFPESRWKTDSFHRLPAIIDQIEAEKK
jgi:putative hydrolase of the HAD superfamily